jgi:hypothetical protein
MVTVACVEMGTKIGMVHFCVPRLSYDKSALAAPGWENPGISALRLLGRLQPTLARFLSQ